MIKKARIHIIAVLSFLALSIIFNYPVLSGKTIEQYDNKQYKGSSREIREYREKDDRQIYWTNVIFAGMPSYMTSVVYDGEILKAIPRTLNKVFFDSSVNYMFLLMLSFYLLGISFKVDPLVAILGALGYGFSSYFPILLEAGHNAKIHAMAYLPGILAGMVWAYRRSKPLLGFGLFAFFLSLELGARHPQMFYYFLFLAVPYGIYEGIKAIRSKALPAWLKSTGFLIAGGVLALGTNYSYLKSTLDFGKHTTRGKSELTLNAENKTDGLDRDYVTDWSYGINESWTLLVPNFKGGKSSVLKDYETAMEAVDNRWQQQIGDNNAYFGDQPLTSGPVYAGAVIFLLAFLSLFFYKGNLKYLLLFSFVFTMALAWGKNFAGLTDFFLDNFPYYNKFRAVSSMMVIPEFILPLLAMLGLNALSQWDKAEWQKTLKLPFAGNVKRINALYIGGGILIGFLLLNVVSPGLFNDFINNREAEQFAEFASNPNANQAQLDEYIENLESARQALTKADVLRSLFYILVAGGITWLFGLGRLSRNGMLIGLSALVLLDLFVVDKRYLNKENFIAETKVENNYGVQVSPADQVIMQQYATDPYFRTLNLSVSPFNDATTSFYHYSLGGYHGAKLKIYMELIENQINNEIQSLNKVPIPQVFEQTPALNMLNLRYIISQPNARPIENPKRLGNAWLVKNIKEVNTADEELLGISDINPGETAILRGKHAELAGQLPTNAGTGSIKLKSYDPEKLVYDYNSSTENLAVFSEIWYPEHWKISIDGEETDLIRANYVLRAAKIPAGQHEITMEFLAGENTAGQKTISLISSILVLLAFIFTLYLEIKPKN